MKIVTIHDVAEMAGVGISTVSRVINNRHDVGDKTRQKVREAINTLGYVRNDSASNLKLKHQVSVAVIVSGRRNVFLTEIAEQIINLGRETEYEFLLEFIDEKDDEFSALKRLYLRKKLSAAIFLGSDLDKHLEDIQSFNLPCIFSTISVPQVEGLKTSSVSVDNELYGYKTIEKLISLNHTKIALAGYLSAENSLDYTGKRLISAIKCMKDKGIVYNKDLFIECKFSLDSSYKATVDLLKKHRDFTAVFAMSDIIAMGVIRGLYDSGIRVPEDVSVIGFDGIDQSRYTVPTIATWKQPSEDMAKNTIKLLKRAIAKNQYKHILLDAEWLEGESLKQLS